MLPFIIIASIELQDKHNLSVRTKSRGNAWCCELYFIRVNRREILSGRWEAGIQDEVEWKTPPLPTQDARAWR